MKRVRRRPAIDHFIPFDKSRYVEKELIDTVTLWMLRAIVRAGAFKEFLDMDNYFGDENLAYFLDLGKYVEMEEDEFSRKEVFSLLGEKLRKLEERKRFDTLPSLERNLQRLSRLVGLDETETQIVKLAAVVKNCKLLDTALEYMGQELTTKQAKEALSIILDVEYKKVEEALSGKSVLITSSLINLQSDRWLTSDLGRKLELPAESFTEFLLYSEHEDITMALKDSIRQVDDGVLKPEDYDYIREDVSFLARYLRNSLDRKCKGVNILLYGVAGTGKTELAKTMAKRLNCELYEVSYIDENDEATSGKQRLKAYRSAQALLKNRKILMMYDEAEDIFDTYEGLFRQKKQDSKAWINHMLESNPIPTIWITNDIHSVDPAIVRRFDIAMEMQIPKKKKRIEILDRYSNGMLDRKTLGKLAKNPYISPAVMQRVIKVVLRTEPKDLSKSVCRLIDRTLRAQRYPGLEKKKRKKFKRERLPSTYDPTLLSVDADLEKLAEGIARTRNARLCFYGVPGTGKSAYGRYLAKVLGREVIVKKGSDLLSMWLGGTEQNIAAAFGEAKKRKAVLIFDEVDSFLQDRQNAKRNWEITQVNELLTQMENFEGVFIATTNLMEKLDKASLRRFDMKLEFKTLRIPQAQELLARHFKERKIECDRKNIE
jgi:SpoVK/Ycf46/Vps4 family AAA+-type ATPase